MFVILRKILKKKVYQKSNWMFILTGLKLRDQINPYHLLNRSLEELYSNCSLSLLIAEGKQSTPSGSLICAIY